MGQNRAIGQCGVGFDVIIQHYLDLITEVLEIRFQAGCIPSAAYDTEMVVFGGLAEHPLKNVLVGVNSMASHVMAERR